MPPPEGSRAPLFARGDFLGPDGILSWPQVFFSMAYGLQQANPDLILAPSLQVWVAEDHAKALEDLSVQLGRDLSPTADRGAAGIAMTVDAGDHDIIVMHAGVIETLFTPDGMRALHVIHHELAHAHEHQVTRGRRIPPEEISPLRMHMHPLARDLWSEYHAERRSASTIQGESLTAPLLVDAVDQTPAEISALVQQYRYIHRDHVRLLKDTTARVRHLLKMAGYALGDLAGTGSDPAELDPGLPAALAKPPLADLWPRLQEALGGLYGSMEQWHSLTVFVPLEELLREIYARLGLHFQEGEMGLWFGPNPPPTKSDG